MIKEGGTSMSERFKNMNVTKDWEEDDQVRFVRKVYSILAVQMAITSAFIFVA